MGVASSFSISLLAHKDLWGLISCHNYTPRFINYKSRDASKIIGQILSSALEYRQEEEFIHTSAAFHTAADELADYIEKEDDMTAALTSHDITIRDIVAATGAVLVFDRKITRIGITPEEEQIKEIVEWLIGNMQNPIYSSHHFPGIFHPAKEYSQIASGIIACMLSKEMKELIIWFKPEQIKKITWAGNPAKPVSEQEDGQLTISPRKSFEKWTELVKNKSGKWSNGELAIVIKIREQIIYTINRRANEIRLLNDRLKLAYEELDTFSYTVSHDLRSPLSSIKSYSELLSTTNKSLDEDAKKMLDRIINNAVKYSARSKPAKVKVEGVKNNNEIVYSISDNGIGIDINYYSHVFELFKRMDNVKDFEGTGVGLAIVKRIVEKHKARIWFDSTLGAGTIFYIAFSGWPL